LSDFYDFCREVCSVIVEEQSEPIGGVGKVEEIDDSKFGKRKYNRGKRVDGVWVFAVLNVTPTHRSAVLLQCKISTDSLIPVI